MYFRTKRKVFKTNKIKFLLAIVIVLFANHVMGQDDKYEEFIIGEKIYKPGCGWFKLSTGTSYNIKREAYESSSNICYSFRVKNTYLQLGYHSSSDMFFTKRSSQKLNDLYISIGSRKETKKSNISVFAGPSYAYGANYFETNTLGLKYYKAFTRLGLIANAEYTFKIFYDMGLGLSIFGSYNERYKVAGIQLHVYLSGAFKGKIE